MKFGEMILVFSFAVYTANAASAGYQKRDLDNGNFKVMWMYNKSSDNLTFHLEVKAVGWVGFGFAKTAPNSMANYDVIVGSVTDAGEQYLSVSFSFVFLPEYDQLD